MCEILPEVGNCCMLCSYRVGMLLIAVLAMITGATTLSIIEKLTDASYDSLKNVSEIREPERALSGISQLIPSGITAMSVLFMILGFILLFATLTADEGFVQIFVWGTFLTTILGFLMILGIAFECMFKNACLLSGMDWLSGSTLLVALVMYLFAWIYFVIVANSYVVNGDV